MIDQNLDKKTSSPHFTRIDLKKPQVKVCDNCGKEIPASSEKCSLCGIEFERWVRFKLKGKVGGLEHLSDSDWSEVDRAWKKVAAFYNDKELHHSFLHLCYNKKALNYAVFRYGEILKLNSSDDIAQLMKRQAMSLSQDQGLQIKSKPTKDKLTVSFPRWPKYVSLLGLFSGAMLTVMGSLHLPLAEFVGAGIAICVFSLGLYYLSRALS